MKKKILVVFGTRPEAIKLAPLISRLKAIDTLDVEVCVTGQHRQMLDQVLDLFNIVPDYDLDLMRHGQDLTDVTSGVLTHMRDVLHTSKPDWLVVHGDTTTALGASLAAYYAHVPVAHVEAGLRTGNIYAPWPEEINRKLISSISTVHFAPSEGSKMNLLREGIDEKYIHMTGNPVIDVLLDSLAKIETDPLVKKELTRFSWLDANRKLILVTAHRRENFGKGFEEISNALKQLADRPDVQIVYPVHLNPNVQEPVRRILGNHPRVHLIDPQEYLPFIYLMNKAHIILTDSGGIQEEAPSLGKPVLVMRHTTERPEAIAAGVAKLVGANRERIIKETELLLDDDQEYARMSQTQNPYGDGLAALRIAELFEGDKIINPADNPD